MRADFHREPRIALGDLDPLFGGWVFLFYGFLYYTLGIHPLGIDPI